MIIDHEWSKHGTCSGLDQYTYLNNGVNSLLKYPTPSRITNNVGGNVSAADLRADFGASYISLQCTYSAGKYFLNGAYLCLSRDAQTGLPGGKTSCPADVFAEDNCKADTIYIASF